MDEATGYKFSLFLRNKSSLASSMTDQLSKEKISGQEVKYICIDNAGENKILEKSLNSSSNNLNVDIEYIARKRYSKTYQLSRYLL